MSEYFIGIDCGTQGTKVIVFDVDSSKVVAQAYRTHSIIEDATGKKEQNPQEWLDACEQALLEVLSKINSKKVKGIGVSGQQHGFVPLDKNDNVIRPAKLWNDTTTQAQCDYLIKKLGGIKRVIKLIGNGIPPGYTVSKIVWLKQKEPWNYKKLRTILLPHNYINFWLTGEKKMEFGDASGTAMLNIKRRIWSKEVLKAIDDKIDIIDMLPPLQQSEEICGYLRKELADKFNLNKDVIVSTGGGDNMMSAIGTGNVKEGVVTVSLGTSGTIFAYSTKPVFDPNGELAAFCDSTGAWLPLVCTMNVTVATELARKLFGDSIEKLNKEIENSPAGSDGLILLPYFHGERTPNIPDGTGVFFGVNSLTFNKSHLYRASMEGVTLGLRYGFEILKRRGIKPKQIRVTGGGAKSKLWRQILSDVLNCEVVCMEIEESAAFGAALQALWAYLNLHKKTSIVEITDKYCKIKPETRCEPIKSNVEKYNLLYQIQTELSKSLKLIFDDHKRFLENYSSIKSN